MIKIYNQSLQLTAILENAYAIGYETPLNSLWTASFSLPANDEKNAECLPLMFVEIFEGDTRVDLFRIVPNTATRSSSGETISYECEHVLATLFDDVLFQYHTVGNLGFYTEDVIDYILDAQTVTRWQTGNVYFTRQFEYNYENENLLGALFAVPKPFDEEFQWTWDTSSYPWTLNLITPASGVQAYIRYGVNMQGVTKVTDPTELCTRIFPLGYGEGVNQLTIREVNGGLPYIDSDTIGTYGTISRIFVDRRFNSAESLLGRAQTILNELKTPRITYSVDASELYALTDDPLDRFITGTQVRIIDEELSIDVIARVVNVSKSDITGAPGDVQIQIANKPADIASSIADLADRQRISEVYAQGATNIDSHDFADNCDPTHPAVLRFWVPSEAIRINKVQLSYDSEGFRAYSKAIEGGGAIATSTAAGGGTTQTSTTSDDWNLFAISIPQAVSFFPDHDHGGEVSDDGGHYHSLTADHTHDVTLPNHMHNITLPNHTHGIEYGIFEGPTPSSVTVKVDGNSVPGMGVSESNVDLIPYLAVDGDGKVLRGQFHEIQITPNSLGRIVATVIVQLFVQSRGGGDF
ncbi:phage tail protein [Paenibacillus oryzisoli]|uniref:Tail spike domain-containing protein n=1 Tax=Paenibacillus oryzisoli TaxID=1850517 RepID=A0A198AHZ7_9BACL|nr:phage tail protein [Paenibacillus oryzisoli]OAS21129.1 hypothetical protein A8708_30020 [Paenibacillus oryzisoli]